MPEKLRETPLSHFENQALPPANVGFSIVTPNGSTPASAPVSACVLATSDPASGRSAGAVSGPVEVPSRPPGATSATPSLAAVTSGLTSGARATVSRGPSAPVVGTSTSARTSATVTRSRPASAVISVGPSSFTGTAVSVLTTAVSGATTVSVLTTAVSAGAAASGPVPPASDLPFGEVDLTHAKVATRTRLRNSGRITCLPP